MYCAILLILAVLAVYAFFSSRSIAWFASNKNVGGSGMGISVVADDSISISSLRALKYDTETRETSNVLLDVENPNLLQLNRYDKYFEERRQYTSMILIASLDNMSGSVFTVTVNCTGDLYAGDEMASNLSNVLELRCGISSALDEWIESPSELYQQAKQFFETAENAVATNSAVVSNTYWQGQFVTLSGAEINPKNNTLDFTVNLGENVEELNLYFYLNYQPDLVEKFIDLHWNEGSGSGDFFGSNEEEFAGDITLVTVEKKQENAE